jgi:ectoine hydroxylase-related dioxygenase (phytanoyl-CoA dioxygenase family)
MRSAFQGQPHFSGWLFRNIVPMTIPKRTARYGVRIENQAIDDLDETSETLQLLGYAILDSGLSAAQIVALRERFVSLHDANRTRYGVDRLAAIGENDLLRCPLADDPLFLQLACNPRVREVCERLLGPGFILNQQNGIVNPAGAEQYSQSAFHRDLPYQHFVSSRPLAINALFCLDPFTTDNGATLVIPASHKQEAFPSERVIAAHTCQVEAPAGSFLMLDCMTYHCGGANRTAHDRRAVNHVYSIALMRQQIDVPAYLGPNFSDDPATRQLLGYRHPLPRSVDDFIDYRLSQQPPPR